MLRQWISLHNGFYQTQNGQPIDITGNIEQVKNYESDEHVYDMTYSSSQGCWRGPSIQFSGPGEGGGAGCRFRISVL